MTQPAEIVTGSTRLSPVPLVPEIRLYQAREPMGVWQDTEQATGRTGLDPPFWAFAWAGGQALARYLLDHPETVTGRHVIDVASGSGLVAIAAARAGAASVTAYDIDPLAAAAITLNAAANDVAVQAVCCDALSEDPPPAPGTDALDTSALPARATDPLDTGALPARATDALDTGALPAPGTDLVLVADAFYERDLAAAVMRFLDRSRARGAAVLAGDFGRRYLPRARLSPLASYDVTGLAALEDRDVKRTTVWTLQQTIQSVLGQ